MRTDASVRLSAALVAVVALLMGSAGIAEQDHLLVYKAKDLNQIPGAVVTVDNQYGSQSCELKKAKFLLVQSEKNAGNDARSGQAGKFVCYKAKCTGLLPVQDTDSQFGIQTMEAKKAQLLCLPVDFCPSQGTNEGCSAYSGGGACGTCCDGVAACQTACTTAVGSFCVNTGQNAACAEAITTAGCATDCCP